MPIHDWTRVDAGLFHAFHHDYVEHLAVGVVLPDMPIFLKPDFYVPCRCSRKPTGQPGVSSFPVPMKRLLETPNTSEARGMTWIIYYLVDPRFADARAWDFSKTRRLLWSIVGELKADRS